MGGVIVIGPKASGAGANTPDVVRDLAPVADRHAVASATLDIILQSVEPGIEDIRTKTIADGKSKPSGFVLLFVPASDGSPRRSKVDSRFYVRIASGTLPMEFFQIEERFGRRPLPRLSLATFGITMSFISLPVSTDFARAPRCWSPTPLAIDLAWNNSNVRTS